MSLLAADRLSPSQDGPRQENLHVVWVNQHASFVGGCEQYVLRTAKLLAAEGVRNTLLYEVDGAMDADFAAAFDGAFPLVEPQRQLESLGADLCYVHRLANDSFVDQLTSSPTPCLRFYHDHSLFCLREHKYTTIGQQTCQRTTGLGCYACLGFLRRSETWPGVGISTLGDLHRRQYANLHWDGHVVGSEYMATHLRAHGFDSTRLHTVPLYVSQQHLQPLDGEVRRRSNLIVFAGQLVRGKGVDLLLRAMQRLPADVELRVAGSGRQQQELQALAEQLSLGGRVRFTGRLDSDQLRRLLREATVFAMPSRAPETFGLAGLEAASQGAPVVAADVGGIGQWLHDGQNGLLFRSGDVAALTASLSKILKNPPLARQLGETGRGLCRREFSPRRHAKRLMKIFGVCVKGELS